MGDIRSFFGGPAAAPSSTADKKSTKPKGRRKRAVSDSDDDPIPPKTKLTKAEPIADKIEETDASAYFGAAKKTTKAEPTAADTVTTPKKPSPEKTTRSSSRRKPQPVYQDASDSEAGVVESKGKESPPKSEPKSRAKRPDTPPSSNTPSKPDPVSPADFTMPPKRKAAALDDDTDGDSPPKKTKKTTKTTKASAKATPATAHTNGGAQVDAILKSIPLITPPPPPEEEHNADGSKKKFPFGAHANSAAPAAAGQKEVPQGAENCLTGLSFVFTGLLQTLQREEGQNLVKQYGGKVTGAPSKKTDFIVLGSDAGPSKLKKIAEFALKTIDEDGLFELVRRMPANGGDSAAAGVQAEKVKKEEANIKAAAKEMDKQEDERIQSVKAANSADSSEPSIDSRLWTVKYAPQQLTQICGNKGQVEKLQKWLHDFEKNQRINFKMAGKDGSGVYRAVMIHGPPGIGKTTAAHLAANMEGYDVVESNASDTRSKKLVDTGLKGILDSTSLLGYFAGDGKRVQSSKRKLLLIMDEVDGMSAGDRGGVGALAAVCKKTNVPMILICNDRKLPKMKPFDGCTYDMPFRRPTTDMIKGRIMTILFREGMKLPPPVINAIIEGTGADLRQIVNMISSIKLDQTAMDFEESKKMSKAWQKHAILKPWDIVSKILGGGMFGPASKATLNDKVELYFNDHELSYLMLQENYLGTSPIRANNEASEREARMKRLSLFSRAADSISDGDLVDRMIHGSQQQWSLMPTHAMFAFVRPASFISGSLAGGQTRFPAWLGKNSAQSKAIRLVKELQGHMRLRATGDRHEIRQQYVPVLWTELIKKLADQGKDSVDAMIELMDSYYLTKDDFDALMELGVGPMEAEKVKIDSASKAAFTREYNKREHPISFLKASTVVAPKSKAREKPDLEEAFDESEDEAIEIKEEDDEDQDKDLSKDKYIKQAKKKAAPKAASKTKTAGKKGQAADDIDDASEEDVKPKAKAAKGKAARGKGKAK